MNNPSSASVLLPAVCIGLLAWATRAHAVPTFTVNSNVDAVDVNPGNGICASGSDGNGLCTLRAAIMEANRSSGLGATIVLPAGTYMLAIPAAGSDGEDNGDLDLTTPVSGNPVIHIVGAGAATSIIDANQIDRALFVEASRTVTISGVTIRNGYRLGTSGGGISNLGTLSVTDCIIDGNQTDAAGGGIYTAFDLHLARATIRSNTAFLGGAVYVAGYATVRDSTLYNNGADYGGGIEVFGAVPATLYVIDSTISSNYANTNGGGIDSEGTTFLFNASVVGNDADHDRDQNGGIGGGIYANAGSVFGVVNTLIAGNTMLAAPIADNCNGTLEAYGLSLLDDPTGCTTNTSNANLGFVSLSTIGPLQNNGGPTWTHALLAGSQAIDGTRDSQICVDETGVPLITDQRGAPRVAGTRCDVGAFEAGTDLLFKNGFD